MQLLRRQLLGNWRDGPLDLSITSHNGIIVMMATFDQTVGVMLKPD